MYFVLEAVGDTILHGLAQNSGLRKINKLLKLQK